MSEKRIEYDANKDLIKIYRSFSAPRTLVPNEEIKKWSRVLQAGEDDQGRRVKQVRYIFSDEETAEYNQQPLAFAKINTYLATGGEEEPYGEDPNFSVREDFGIKGEEE